MEVMPTRFAKAGDVIFSQGDFPEGGLFYICYGKVEVSRREADDRRTLAELGEGAVFGEMALINSMPRNATITAKEDCGFYNISRETFQHNVMQLEQPMRGIFQTFVLTIRDFLEQHEEWLAEKEEWRKTMPKEVASPQTPVSSHATGGGLQSGEGIKLKF